MFLKILFEIGEKKGKYGSLGNLNRSGQKCMLNPRNCKT